MKSKPTLKEVGWAEVSDEVKAVNPEIYSVLNQVSPEKELRLYVGEYPFGCKILKGGKFHVPLESGEMVPLNDHNVPKQLQNDLSYNVWTNPASLVLKNCIELFMPHKITNVPVTFAVVNAGEMISVSRVLCQPRPYHPAFLWDMTAGARSLFALPKISQQRRYKRLRSDLGIEVDVPTSTLEHWALFKKLSMHGSVRPWSVRMLFFSKAWFDHLDDPVWIKFKCLLLERYKRTFDVLGNMYIWDVIITLILRKRDIRPSLYVKNTVQHLLQLCVGAAPGMAPATNGNMGPIADIQKILVESYNLQEYIPTIMVPTYHDLYKKCDPILYSLHHPNLLADASRKKDNSSLISETHDVVSLLAKVLYDLKYADLNIRETPLYDIPRKSEIEAFHTMPNNYSLIRSSEVIIKEDPRFMQSLYPTPAEKVAVNSSIFKGCFRIKQV